MPLTTDSRFFDSSKWLLNELSLGVVVLRDSRYQWMCSFLFIHIVVVDLSGEDMVPEPPDKMEKTGEHLQRRGSGTQTQCGERHSHAESCVCGGEADG